MLNILFGFLWLFILFLFHNFYWKGRKLPPGPAPWPMVGNTLEIVWHKPGYKLFERWAKKFGPVYTYWLGADPIIAVTDFELIKDTFLKDGESYAGRYFFDPVFEMLKANPGQHGVVQTQGEKWYKLRKTSLKILKELGMGSNQMELMALQELDVLLQSIYDDLGKKVDQHSDNNKGCTKPSVELELIPRINLLAGSTINQVVLGFSFHGKNEAEFHELKQLIIENGNVFTSPRISLVVNYPFLRHLPVFSAALNLLDMTMTHIYNFFDKHIQPKLSQNSVTETDNMDVSSSSFVDQFLAEIEAAKGRSDEKFYGLHSLRTLCFDLFVAGQETTSATINFLLLYLLLDQRVQKKLHAELDNVVHAERTITYSERTRLPYLNAVINETMRLSNILPQNLIHKTTRDVQIRGYSIAKGTKIVPQISCVLYDEKIFPKPHEFIPERFLDINGQLKKCEELIPFSVGKRQCLGESLARMELFLFTANFFNKFQVYPSNPMKPPTTEKITGFGVMPSPYTCLVESRSV